MVEFPPLKKYSYSWFDADQEKFGGWGLLFVLEVVLSLESKILPIFSLRVFHQFKTTYAKDCCNLRTFPERKGSSRNSVYAQGELHWNVMKYNFISFLGIFHIKGFSKLRQILFTYLFHREISLSDFEFGIFFFPR